MDVDDSAGENGRSSGFDGAGDVFAFGCFAVYDGSGFASGWRIYRDMMLGKLGVFQTLKDFARPQALNAP